MIFDTLQNVNPGKPDMQAMGGGGGMSAISGMFNRGQQQRAPFAGAMDWMRQRMGGQGQMGGIAPPHMGQMGGGGFEGMGRPMAPGGFNGMNTLQQPQQMQQLQNPMRWG